MNPDTSKQDSFTKAGARRLKARIEAYWRERGYAVEVHIRRGAFTPVLRSARFDVRSSLVNGRPQPHQRVRAGR